MKFAQRVFATAGVWGLVVLSPLYFLLDEIGRQSPPAITHPEFFYGFIAVTLAWQVAFLVIASDPIRYRLVMLPAMLEKFGYVATVLVLFAQARLASSALVFVGTDFLLGVLFVLSFIRTKQHSASVAGA
jgi:hypothetical protein